MASGAQSPNSFKQSRFLLIGRIPTGGPSHLSHAPSPTSVVDEDVGEAKAKLAPIISKSSSKSPKPTLLRLPASPVMPKPSWTLRIYSDSSVSLTDDNQREQEIANIKKAWESADSGRALKAMELRSKFLAQLNMVQPEEARDSKFDDSAVLQTDEMIARREEQVRLDLENFRKQREMAQTARSQMADDRSSTKASLMQALGGLALNLNEEKWAAADFRQAMGRSPLPPIELGGSRPGSRAQP